MQSGARSTTAPAAADGRTFKSQIQFSECGKNSAAVSSRAEADAEAANSLYVLSFSLSLLDHFKVLNETKKVQDLIIFVVVQE